MAIYTGTYSGSTYGSGASGSKVTRREWIVEQIAYVSAVETPILHMLEKIPVNNIKPEWVMDDITDIRPAAQCDTDEVVTAIEEDAAFDPNTAGDASRVVGRNYTEILAKAWRVTDTQRLMNEVGISDEYNHLAWKAFYNVAMQFELALLYSDSAAGDISTARRMDGLVEWAVRCGENQAASATMAAYTIPVPFKSTYYAGTGVDLTPDILYDEILSPYWDKGANVDQSIAFVGPKLKRVMSGFAMVYSGSGATLNASPLNERTIPTAAKTIADSIDIFQTDVGTLYVNKHRGLNIDTLIDEFGASGNIDIIPDKMFLMIEPRYFQIGVLQGFHIVPLARDGLTSQAAALAQMTLLVRNPRAMAIAHNVVA